MFKVMAPAGPDEFFDSPEAAVDCVLQNTSYYLDESFDMDLDSGDKWVTFKGESYRPSELLRCIPEVYQVEFECWYARERQDLVDRLNKLHEGDHDCFYGYIIERV